MMMISACRAASHLLVEVSGGSVCPDFRAHVALFDPRESWGRADSDFTWFWPQFTPAKFWKKHARQQGTFPNVWMSIKGHIFIVRKSKHPPTVFRVVTSNDNVMFPSSSHVSSDWTQGPISNTWRRYSYPGSRGWLLEVLHLATGLCLIPHYKANLVLTVKKFLRPHHPKYLAN